LAEALNLEKKANFILGKLHEQAQVEGFFQKALHFLELGEFPYAIPSQHPALFYLWM
jgi:hypothetical protein